MPEFFPKKGKSTEYNSRDDWPIFLGFISPKFCFVITVFMAMQLSEENIQDLEEKESQEKELMA